MVFIVWRNEAINRLWRFIKNNYPLSLLTKTFYLVSLHYTSRFALRGSLKITALFKSKPKLGEVAQWQSICFARRGSRVRFYLSPPSLAFLHLFFIFCNHNLIPPLFSVISFQPTRYGCAKVFNKSIQYIAGADKQILIPNYHYSEVAFIGKSNVGKSSLIMLYAREKTQPEQLIIQVVRLIPDKCRIQFFTGFT